MFEYGNRAPATVLQWTAGSYHK